VLYDLLARRIAQATPSDAVVARLDGEAYCVGLAVRDDTEASHLADALVGALAEPFLTEQGAWRITVNVGIAVRPAGTLRSTSGMLRDARTALVQAARLGPNRALLFDPDLPHLHPTRACQRRRRRHA
jgi:GGDEF domain-containing protein